MYDVHYTLYKYTLYTIKTNCDICIPIKTNHKTLPYLDITF